MLDWLGDNTDLLAMLLAVFGLLLTLFTVWLSVRQSRVDAYARMHETLIEPRVAAGRRLLHLAHANHNFPAPGDPGWDEINQSLAMFDTLGVYMRNHIVSRKLTMGAWFHPLCAIHEPAVAWLSHRMKHGHKSPWPSLTDLLDAAEAHHAKQGCCRDDVPSAE